MTGRSARISGLPDKSVVTEAYALEMRISDERGLDRPEANTPPEDQLDFRVDIAAPLWAILVGEHGRDGCGEGAGPEAPVVPRLTVSPDIGREGAPRMRAARFCSEVAISWFDSAVASTG